MSSLKNYKAYDVKDYQNLKGQLQSNVKGLGPNITDEVIIKQIKKK